MGEKIMVMAAEPTVRRRIGGDGVPMSATFGDKFFGNDIGGGG
ncbi:hypothetical protein FACS1894107_12040 [Planctomycetales bacterium]|nr:hypothetical protein FACS1894107_12040 [Planctomycetales bacterium]GHT00461.1 hypothetical protein FACS1894108_12560 [Planctomycetales bacterium]